MAETVYQISDAQLKTLLDAKRGVDAQNGIHQLRESNRKVMEDMQGDHMRQMADDIQYFYGVDIGKLDFANRRFDWRALKESCRKLSRRVHEVNAVSTFGQLLRAGVQTIANAWYQQVPTTYRDWAQEVPSNKRQEWYPPLHRAGFPRRVSPGAKFPEVKVAGLDIVIVNEKFGDIIGFERELWDDDQTGQIAQRAQDGGGNMAVLEEIWAYARLGGAATSYQADAIPASQTKPANETNWPWSTSFVGGGANRPATYLAFNRINLITSWQALFNQLDLLGNKMLVMPDTIICSKTDYFDALALMNSEWFPSVPGAAGTTGTNFARNVLKGLANVVLSRFMTDKQWLFGQAGRGFIFQRRDPTEVIQENPASGMSFEQDEVRYRVRARWEPDWVDPRWWYQGDDGSV